LDRAATKKATIAAKKVLKNTKLSRIVIFKVRSTFLGSLGSYKHVIVENLDIKAAKGVLTTKLRR
jgi:hypothetical protein